eukprot:COSAG06_NODE_547_length_14431_cov_5.614746_3_plen_479_part_00
MGSYGQDGRCYECDARMSCLAEGLDQPHAKPGFWLKARNPDLPRCRDLDCPGLASCRVDGELQSCEAGCPDGQCPTMAECVPLEGCAHGGVENCTLGYYKERCSACDNRFYRLEGRCEPCPANVIPFWLYMVVGFATVLASLLLLEYVWSSTRLRKLDAGQMGQLTGPAMVFMTFMQTIGTVLSIPRIKIPDELRLLMTKLNMFNFNLELANPECSIKWNFQSKLHMTLAAPWVALVLVHAYKLISIRYLNKTEESAKVTVLTAHCGLFSLMTVFYLKTTLAAWDCSANADGFTYLDAQPDIRCVRGWIDPTTLSKTYDEILWKSFVGMLCYTLALLQLLQGIFGLEICVCCKKKQGSASGEPQVDRGGAARFAKVFMCGLVVLNMEKGRQQFAFFASKSRNQWYWWELVVLGRKVSLTVVAMFNTVHVERGWWVMSLIQMAAICSHLMVQPYRDHVHTPFNIRIMESVQRCLRFAST